MGSVSEHGIFLGAGHQMIYNFMKAMGLFGRRVPETCWLFLLVSFPLNFRASILIFHS